VQVVQLYINDTYIDLFKDEQISLTESIRNAKDIAKVFTTFSKQFTVPASKQNNKVFKHYYNFDIVNGFDGRKIQPARIEINNLPYKEGKIRLTGVQMRNNAPFAYNIVFYGSIISLKDVLGEDKLTDLDDLGSINKDYDNSSILTALQTLPGETALPLVTANQQLYYDSTDTAEGTGNLYYESPKIRGLNPKQLKYAVRLDKIIDAIESKYSDITFASDSFFKDATKDIHKLYMWCHRKKDEISITAGGQQKVVFNSTFGQTYFNIDSVLREAVIGSSPQASDTFEFVVSAAASDIYDLVITKNGTIVDERLRQTGSYTFSTGSLSAGDRFLAYIRTYEKSITFTGMRWVYKQSGIEVQSESAPSGSLSYLASFFFNIKDQIPEQKIIDFLSNLFKMFNLVAYVNDVGEIQVQPLDTYYASPTEHNITDYVDSAQGEVNVALPYREVFFKYKDTKTILAAQHYQELSDIEWGANEYKDAENLYGEVYKVEPSFNHSKFERLIDLAPQATNTNVVYGLFADDNLNGYLGDPLIMYIDQQPNDVDLSINNDGVLNLWQAGVGALINMPSNLEDIVDETSNNIHFDSEFSEYDGLLAEQTLFKRFYENYIVNIFDQATRLTKVTAYLPVKKIVKSGDQIKLSDVVILNNNKYRINSMNINLTTGKTEFELINYYD
jgi:hypothetical protein